MLNACISQDRILNKSQLKYITESNLCKKLKNDIHRLETYFDDSNYQKWLNIKQKMEMIVQKK